METNKTIVLGIELDTSGLIEAAADAKKSIDDLKAKQKTLDVSSEQGRIQFEKNAASIRELNTTYKDTTKLIDNATKVRNAETNSLEQMKAQLSIATKQYDLMGSATRIGTKEGVELEKQIRFLTDSLKKEESAIGDNRRNVGNYEASLKGLKAELKDIANQLGGMDAGSKAYRDAALRAGELKDKIKEVNENVKALAGGSSFEKLGNTFGQLKGDITNLDFAGVSEKAKVLTTISKEMTFAEATGGIKSMGSALLNLGKAILSNPLFLLAAVIIGTVAAIYEFTKAAKSSEEENKTFADSIKNVNDNLSIQNGLIDFNTKLQIINLKNLGATEEAIAIKQINSLKEKEKLAKQAYIDAEEQNKAALKRYGEEDELTKKALENSKKLYADYQKSKQDVIIAGKEAEAALIKKSNDEEEQSNKDALAKKSENNKKFQEKSKADLKIANDNILKDKIAAIEIDILMDKEFTEKWLNDKIRLLREEADQEIAKENTTAIQKELINKKFADAETKLREETVKANQDIVKKDLEDKLKTIVDSSERETIVYTLSQLEKKRALDDMLESGLIDYKKYNQELAQLDFETAQQQKQFEVEKLANEIVLIKDDNNQKLKLELELAQKKRAINDAQTKHDRDNILASAALDKQIMANRLQVAQSFFGGLASMFDKGSDEYKAFATLQTAASTAQGAMAAFSGAQSAFGALGPEISFPIGFAAAAAVVAEGAVQIGKINDLGFEQGGYTTKGNPKEEANNLGNKSYTYHKSEYVVPAKVLNTGIGSQLVSSLESMRLGNPYTLGLPGMADGGFAMRSISNPVNDNLSALNKIHESISKIQVVARIEDIINAGNNKMKIESRATI